MACFQLHEEKMQRKKDQMEIRHIAVAVLDGGILCVSPHVCLISFLRFPQLAYNNLIGHKSFLNILKNTVLLKYGPRSNVTRLVHSPFTGPPGFALCSHGHPCPTEILSIPHLLSLTPPSWSSRLPLIFSL